MFFKRRKKQDTEQRRVSVLEQVNYLMKEINAMTLGDRRMYLQATIDELLSQDLRNT